MARLTKPLTHTEVNQAKPKAKEYSLMDGNGLKLRIKPNGSKLWLFNYYRPYTKKRANLGLGSFPAVSLASARTKRKEARELLAQDIDPMEQRNEQQQAQLTAHTNTLEHIAAQWFVVKKTTITPNYADSLWRSLELHVFPSLGKIPIHKIKAPATITTLKPVAAKGSLETVKRIAQRLNEIMTYAVNTGLLQSNPLTGIGKAFQAPDKKNMPALKPGELPELMQTLTTASIKITTRCLIEWQLHTMVRPSEAAGAQWREIDIDNKIWLIPAERMKKKKSHMVPLTPQAIALLEVMRPISSERQYV
ncbi:MAG: integrase, partial [Oceanicoccus sp.]